MIHLNWKRVQALKLLARWTKSDGFEFIDADTIVLTDYYNQTITVKWDESQSQYFKPLEPKEVSDNYEDFAWRNDQ